jgi:hypothetical protein
MLAQRRTLVPPCSKLEQQLWWCSKLDQRSILGPWCACPLVHIGLVFVD